MGRTPLYSRSPQRPAPPVAAADPGTVGGQATGAVTPGPSPFDPTSRVLGARADAAPPIPTPDSDPPGRAARLRQGLARHERLAWLAGAVLLAGVVGWPSWTAKVKPALTLEQIDAAVRESIAKEPLASAQAAAYEAVLPSVVRVVGEHDPVDGTRPAGVSDKDKGPPGVRPERRTDNTPDRKPDAKASNPSAPPQHLEDNRSVGTGVVIVNKGLILTNLHVVAGARKVTVTFADGSQSEAVVVSHQPENDLAVLQAKVIPDDLHAATLRSTSGLGPGEHVVAVGFPFGIGPSASAGVVSGLKREFRSPEGQRVLSNLIQFDAAANPGNSGGPLVTLDGHVVGIVTAIMNPSGQRTFIGIGFAVPIESAAGALGMHPF